MTWNKAVDLSLYRIHFVTCFWKQLCAGAKSNKQNLIARNCLSKWFSSASYQVRSLWTTCSWRINDTFHWWQIWLFFYIFVKQHIVTYCASTFLNVSFWDRSMWKIDQYSWTHRRVSCSTRLHFMIVVQIKFHSNEIYSKISYFQPMAHLF